MIKYTAELKNQIEEYFLHYAIVNFDYVENKFSVNSNIPDENFNRKICYITAWFISKLDTLSDDNLINKFLSEIGSLIHDSLLDTLKYPKYRLGQAIFNRASDTKYQATCKEITNTEKDCFYNDSNITIFLNTLWENDEA